MYEIDRSWADFYMMQNPKDRAARLEQLLLECEDKNYEFAKTIFELRHEDKKQQGEVDRFLFNCVVLISMYKNGIIFKRGSIKEVNKLMEGMGVGLVSNELEETLCYMEMKNAISRYFSTCKSAGYRRKLFGMMSASDGDKQYNMLEDAWKMSVGISEKFGIEEEMKIWNQAVRDAFSTEYSEALSDYDNFEPKRRKKAK